MIKFLEYFKIPHPLKRGEALIIIDEESYRSNLKDCSKIQKQRVEMSIFRLLVKAGPVDERGDAEDLKKTEKRFIEEERERLNKDKLRLWLSFAVSLIVGYIFYLSFEGLHFQFVTYPIHWIYETFFNRGVDKFVIWAIVAIFPFFAVCRVFLPLKIPKVFKMGRFGALYGLKQGEEVIKALKLLSRDKKRSAKRSIEKYISALKKQAGIQAPLIEKIANALEQIIETKDLPSFSEDFDKLLLELHALSENQQFPWIEVEKLSHFKEELMVTALTGFESGKLIVVSPESGPSVKEAAELNIFRLAAIQKSLNLKKFLDETQIIREKIYHDYENFQQTGDGKIRREILKSLIRELELVSACAFSYHFGDNPSIPHERGKILTHAYQVIYRELGSRLCLSDRKNERKDICSRKKVLPHKKFLLWAAETPLRGLSLAMAVVFLAASVFSFYTLTPQQLGAQRTLVFGTKNLQTRDYQFLGEKLDFREYGQGLFRIFGRDIFWYLPEPLTKPRIVDFTKEQNSNVYKVVITKQTSINLWDRIKRFAQGSFGSMGYEGAEFTITFLPKTKGWINYDFDGRGSLRLSRDLIVVLDSWQAKEMESLYPKEEGDEQNHVYTDYLEKLAKKGEISEYLKGLAQEQYTQRFYYSTNLETVSAIYNLFSLKIDEEIKGVKESDMPEPEKEKKIKNLEVTKENLRFIRDNYQEEFLKEKARLITDPKSMDELLSNLQNRENFYLVWKNFPGLMPMIYNYVFYTYTNEKFLGIITGEFGKEAREEMIGRLKNYLAEQKISEIIEVKEIKVDKFFMTQYDYYMKVQQPIELLKK